jgi:hypothetical protein
MVLGSVGWLNWGYQMYVDYYSFHTAGEGPYYGTDVSGTAIYPNLLDQHHYEEYGVKFDTYGLGYIDVGVGPYPNDYWAIRVNLNFNLFEFSPYRQTVWFSRHPGAN